MTDTANSRRFIYLLIDVVDEFLEWWHDLWGIISKDQSFVRHRWETEPLLGFSVHLFFAGRNKET
jgi:hypothetical protein